jgi:2-succinyl-6-hydroxy-2,4-cyclohexadiene-1-carboxylate synthase
MGLHRTCRPGTDPASVLVHGFTQTSAVWDDVVAGLGDGPQVCRIDLPGHGRSSLVGADLPATAHLLAEAAPSPPATWVGYSLGGRCCLHLALAHPEVVGRLVLVSATAGIDDEGERADRRMRDEALADRIEAIGVPAFLDEWLAQPLFAGVPADAAGTVERATNTAAGLATSLRLAGTGTQEPLWDRLPDVQIPVLLVVGERDERFTAHAHRMASLLPHAEVAVVPGVGHAVPLEAPAALADLLR